MDAHLWTITQAQQELSSKRCSSVELLQHMLMRIEAHNPQLHAFTEVSDTALADARRADDIRQTPSESKPLLGVPIAIKDLIDTKFIKTTYGGVHFRDHRPTTSATVVKRLQAAGAIIIGKTNLHEYAYGTTSENPHFGNVANPWNRSKVAGGSSGGNSAAIVAGLALGAVGTDTGGSIRIPAALTGHVGFKPSYGLISKTGVFPLAHSLDHVGPMAKTVSDVAILLSAMAGYDPSDPTSTRMPNRAFTPQPLLRPLRLGVPKQFFYEKCHPIVCHAMTQVLDRLQGPLITLHEIDVPYIFDVPSAQSTIIGAEARLSHHSLMQQGMAAYGPDVRNRLELGASISADDYLRAQMFQAKFKHAMESVFHNVDALVTPTVPMTATDIGQTKMHIRIHEVLIRAHLTRYTNPWNLSGLPAITLPVGLASDGLPVGLQLVGANFSEQTLLNLAKHIEDEITWTSIAADYRK